MAGSQTDPHAGATEQRPWVTGLLDRVGFGRLSDRSVAGRTFSPLVWFALVVIIVETVLLQG